MPRQRGEFSRRQVMQYIVDNPKRYSASVVERAQQYLDRGSSYSASAQVGDRTKERNSAQRSAARNRRPSGMSSQKTTDAVNRGTGLSRQSVTDRDRLRMQADSYAAFGWGT